VSKPAENMPQIIPSPSGENLMSYQHNQ